MVRTARVTATALIAVALTLPVVASFPADADPSAPPVEPVLPPPPPGDPQTAAELTKDNPGAALAGLLGPGEAVAAVTPDMLAAAALLFPQNYRMPATDQISPYPLTEGAPPGPFARIDAFKGVHAILHGALGRMPRDQLGVPLEGTAPPPGAALPPGLEQFLPPKP